MALTRRPAGRRGQRDEWWASLLINRAIQSLGTTTASAHDIGHPSSPGGHHDDDVDPMLTMVTILLARRGFCQLWGPTQSSQRGPIPKPYGPLPLICGSLHR